MITILMSNFSELPFGRYRKDGANSAERFRDDILIPALKSNSNVTIDFGNLFIGSSFLYESFFFLITKFDFNKDDLIKKIKLVAIDDDIIEEVWDYIKNNPK